MKKIFFILLALLINISFSQGLKYSTSEKIRDYDKFESPLGFSEESLPYKYSLEKYVPLILNQGQTGTCVGFSTLYYGLSTSYNFLFGYTDKGEKYANSFDPYFIYSIMKNDVNDCDEGTYMDQALDLLIKIGAKKYFYPPYINCNSNWNKNKLINISEYISPYKMKTWYYLDVDNVDVIGNIKYWITKGSPVMFGASITSSLQSYSSYNLNGVNSNGLWTPNLNETPTGGHAMCIVGYDDYKHGGVFRVANSWGRDYGDNGYIWIKYSDFKKYAKEIYLYELDNVDINSNPSIKSNNYVRVKLSDGEVYEGGTNNNNYRNGYGINSYTIDNSRINSIGSWNNGYKDGAHIQIEDSGMWEIIYENGKRISWDKLGFSGSENIENHVNKKEFFEMANPGFKFKKRYDIDEDMIRDPLKERKKVIF
tara:strand:+ start:313 stop:1584 length:1272 start_codon:yes stop_codon:yes gene_type:complete